MEPPSYDDVDRMEWSGELTASGQLAAMTSGLDKAVGADDAGRCGDANTDEKPACRYGRGCSHTTTFHRAHYSHPSDVLDARSPQPRMGPSTSDGALAAVSSTNGGIASLSGLGGFFCNECGLDFATPQELRLHMVRKTAWSNHGLVGCRVSCLVDNREWHEGTVTHVRLVFRYSVNRCSRCPLCGRLHLCIVHAASGPPADAASSCACSGRESERRVATLFMMRTSSKLLTFTWTLVC